MQPGGRQKMGNSIWKVEKKHKMHSVKNSVTHCAPGKHFQMTPMTNDTERIVNDMFWWFICSK